jgi:hypothetical protein
MDLELNNSAFVTNYRMLSVLRKIDSDKIDDPIKDHFKKKYFFLSDNDINTISVYCLFLQDPFKFIENNYVKWKDSKIYIFESQPAFHKDSKCDLLNSKFDDMFIPKIMREQGKVDELRQWAEKNKETYLNNLKNFITDCIQTFNTKYPKLELVPSDFEKAKRRDNSGSEEFKNLRLEELKNKAKEIIEDAKLYFEDSKKKRVLEYFRNKGFLRNVKESIRINPTELDQKEIKDILKEIDRKFIEPINEVIIQICIREFLNNQQFNITVLEVLNFKRCKKCFTNTN